MLEPQMVFKPERLVVPSGVAADVPRLRNYLDEEKRHRRGRVTALARYYERKARRDGDFDYADEMAETAERGTGEAVWPLPDPGPCAEMTT
jgi:hypothetical protein